ncbi:MAG: porin [Burkholderiales bacterium]|nr:porin [Burkholderiales bacterium]MDE1925816.1 porin [Burkholderiales bacterium]
MKIELVIGAGALAVSACSMAQGNVSIYGIMDAAVSAVSTGQGGGSMKRLDSGVGPGSRLGFRGVEDLGGGLAGQFVLESGIAVDTGTSIPGGLAFGRQSWVGLKSENWTVSLGRQYSPMDDAVAFSSVNALYYWGSPLSMGFGSDAASHATPASGGFQSTDRISNSLAASRSVGNLTLKGIFVFNDEASSRTGRFLGLGGVYVDGPLRLDVAFNTWRQYASEINNPSSPDTERNWFVGGSYNFGSIKLNAGYYYFSPSSANKSLATASNFGTKAAWIGAKVPFGSSAISGQVMRADYKNLPGVEDGRATTVSLAYEYFLSKRTTLYCSMGSVENNATSAQKLFGGGASVVPANRGSNASAASLGMTLKF